MEQELTHSLELTSSSGRGGLGVLLPREHGLVSLWVSISEERWRGVES